MAQCEVEIVGAGDTLNICDGTSIELSATGADTYTWSPAEDFSDPDSSSTSLTPSASQWYVVQGTIADSTCLDSVYILLFDPVLDIVPGQTDSICQDDGIFVTLEANGPLSNIEWSPATGVSAVDINTFHLTPVQSTVYSVTAVVGNCTLEDSIDIPVIPFLLDLSVEDTAFLCLDDSLMVNINLVPADADLTWSPDDTTVNWQPGQQTAWLKPTVTTEYTVIASDGQCRDTVVFLVRVDSLPDLTLNLVVPKPFYCAGEIITIYSETADSIRYPDIMFNWTPDDGQIQDSTNTENVAIILQDTTLFRRITMNNACIDTSEVMVNVIPPVIPLSVTDTILCPGESFQVEVLDDAVEDLEWMPGDGLSCTNCPDPIVTVQEGAMTYTVSGEKEGCPVAGSLNVSIKPVFVIPVAPVITCPGEPVTISFDDTGLFNINAELSNSGSVDCGSPCQSPVTVTTSEANMLFIVADINDDDYCLARGSATINLYPPDEVNFDITEEGPFGQGQTVTVTANTEPPAAPGTTFTWTINGTEVMDAAGTVTIPLNELPFNVLSVEWINSNGCLQQADTLIMTEPPDIKIPNAFTPNNDQRNDIFRPRNRSAAELIEFVVYNRWGQKVFEGDDPDGWDGTFEGEDAPAEVYVYVMKFRFPNGNIETRKGDVTLIR